jgi:hypothetical protein
VSLHHADAVADHEPAGGLLRDRGLERGEGQVERAADGQRFFAYTRPQDLTTEATPQYLGNFVKSEIAR